MARAVFPHGSLRLGVVSVTMAGLLMGCVEGGGSASGTQGQTTASPAAFRAAGGRDVEAPEVFQVTDSGLWDGRPSLGGIWVASPDAIDPERVVIVNPATGKSVNGALFRRERDNPGPPLQISSDAAEALGILAGQPTTISVTALRKRSEAAPPAETSPETTAVAAAAPVEAASEATEGEAIAAAALAATGAAVAGEAAEAVPEAAAAAAEGAVDAAAAEPAKPKTWKERRAEAKARREAERAAKAAAAAEAAAAEAAAEGTEAAVAAEPAATAENAAVAAVESAPLDARTPEVTAAADAAATTAGEAPAEPRKTRRQLREEREAAEAAAAAAAAEAAAAATPAAEAPATDPAAGRSIQIASYSKEANAARAVETLAKIGITGQIVQTERNGQAVWSVVTRGDEAQLTAIKGAGFADAFFLQ